MQSGWLVADSMILLSSLTWSIGLSLWWMMLAGQKCRWSIKARPRAFTQKKFHPWFWLRWRRLQKPTLGRWDLSAAVLNLFKKRIIQAMACTTCVLNCRSHTYSLLLFVFFPYRLLQMLWSLYQPTSMTPSARPQKMLVLLQVSTYSESSMNQQLLLLLMV